MQDTTITLYFNEVYFDFVINKDILGDSTEITNDHIKLAIQNLYKQSLHRPLSAHPVINIRLIINREGFNCAYMLNSLEIKEVCSANIEPLLDAAERLFKSFESKITTMQPTKYTLKINEKTAECNVTTENIESYTTAGIDVFKIAMTELYKSIIPTPNELLGSNELLPIPYPVTELILTAESGNNTVSQEFRLFGKRLICGGNLVPLVDTAKKLKMILDRKAGLNCAFSDEHIEENNSEILF